MSILTLSRVWILLDWPQGPGGRKDSKWVEKVCGFDCKVGRLHEKFKICES